MRPPRGQPGRSACTTAPTAQGVHQCSGLVTTWDGIPLDTTVTLPRAGAGDLPLVAEIHGFGNSKYEYLNPDETAYTDNAFAWARDGYAVLTYTARGLWGSCGTPESRALNPAACARGYIHLADDRYEVRDTQELIGRLVDEGVADPAPDRRHRRLLRRRPVLRPRGALGSQDAAGRPARALAQPGGHAAADRRGGAGHPLD